MSKKSKTTQSQSGQSDPWSPTIPYLNQFLRQLGGLGGIGINDQQQGAFDQLMANAQGGHPYAQQMGNLARSAFQSPNRAPVATNAYQALRRNIGDYASGKYLDPMSNPQMQALLTQVGDDAQNRVASQFAAAGRTGSGAQAMETGRGVTQAQLPILYDAYNRAQDMQMGAANMLYGAGNQTAQTLSGLDAQRQGMRANGIGFGQAALDAKNWGANSILDLQQQMKGMPYQDMSMLASLLFPMAGLGQQTQGFGQGQSSMSLFSDERVKEDVREVGKLADGQTVYAYRYKGDPDRVMQLGVMAQEVEGKVPEAVSTDAATGFLKVEYDAATRRAADIVAKRRAKQ